MMRLLWPGFKPRPETSDSRIIVLRPSHTNLHTPVTCYEFRRETPSIRDVVLRVFLN
ncbi:hypothetical protein Hanom_Chr03g00219741 [Helianthus anomalus]